MSMGLKIKLIYMISFVRILIYGVIKVLFLTRWCVNLKYTDIPRSNFTKQPITTKQNYKPVGPFYKLSNTE